MYFLRIGEEEKISTNPPPIGTKRSKGKTLAGPKMITPTLRVKEYLNEHLKGLKHKYLLLSLGETLSLKKSVINLHIKSMKHENGKIRLASGEKRKRNIISCCRSDADGHVVGETLLTAVGVDRVKVVTAFMKAGVPLSKLDCFHDLLQEDAFSLKGSQHFRDLIPVVHQEDQEKLKKSILGRQRSVIFDGTTHVAEAMVIVVRYIK